MSTQPDQGERRGSHHGRRHHHGHHHHSAEPSPRDQSAPNEQRQTEAAGTTENDRQAEAAAGAREEQNRPAILVDAANVAFFNRDAPEAKASVDNLLAMRRQLEGMGYRPIFIADAALKYKVDDKERLDHLEQEGRILQAPAATQADYFLLAYSTRENLPIVSNDVYRDRVDEFPEAVRRRVPFMIVEGKVIIERENLERVEHAAHQEPPAASGNF